MINMVGLVKFQYLPEDCGWGIKQNTDYYALCQINFDIDSNPVSGNLIDLHLLDKNPDDMFTKFKTIAKEIEEKLPIFKCKYYIGKESLLGGVEPNYFILKQDNEYHKTE